MCMQALKLSYCMQALKLSYPAPQLLLLPFSLDLLSCLGVKNGSTITHFAVVVVTGQCNCVFWDTYIAIPVLFVLFFKVQTLKHTKVKTNDDYNKKTKHAQIFTNSSI